MRYRREATSVAFAEEFLDYSNQLLQGENRNEVQLDTIEEAVPQISAQPRRLSTSLRALRPPK